MIEYERERGQCVLYSTVLSWGEILVLGTLAEIKPISLDFLDRIVNR